MHKCSGLGALCQKRQSWCRPSIMHQVRSLSQAECSSPEPRQPYDIPTPRPDRDSPIPSEDLRFEHDNYSPEDNAFWLKYRSTWGDVAETGINSTTQLGLVGLGKQTSCSVQGRSRSLTASRKNTKTKNSSRARRDTNTISLRQGFQGQNNYLRSLCPPEDFPRANRAFWKWKHDLSETWQLLETSQIPQQKCTFSVLCDLLQAGDGAGVDGMRQFWTGISSRRRRDLWPELMISTLRFRPDCARGVFMATFDSGLVYSYLAQDTIHYLVKHSLSLSLPDGALRVDADGLLQLLKMVFENSPRGYLTLQQSSLYFYTRLLETPDALVDFYRLLLRYKHPMHKFTILQISNRVAKSPQHKMLSVEMLQAAISNAGLDINTPQGAALCTAILSVGKDDTSVASTKSIPTPAEMFERILRCGLEPNLITYTTIIRELCVRKELMAAKQVLELMVQNQTNPDAYVYATIMNGAKLCGHVDTICHTALTAGQQNIGSPPLWNDFLQAIHSVASSEVKAGPNSKRPRVIPAFPLMLQAYSKLFSAENLHVVLPEVANIRGPPTATDRDMDEHEQGQKISIERDGVQTFHGASDSMKGRSSFNLQLTHTIHNLPQRSPDSLLSPTSTTLTTMILGYIQATSNPYHIIQLYSHFRRLLQAREPVVTQLVSDHGSLVHDMVIMALCENEGMLRVALDVVGDMLRDAAGAAEAAGSTNPGQHPPPSVHTWSILLNGFMFHRQVSQGERILHMMCERGTMPNQVTWNTLMAGYARLQKAKKTASVLQRLERAGFDADEFTFRAFSYLSDKATALRYLEAHRIAVPAEETQLEDGPKVESNLIANARRAYDSDIEPKEIHGCPATDDSRNELRRLEDEVEKIANMMDEEQGQNRDGQLEDIVYGAS